MKNITVLGAGLVGSAIIRDLATDFSVLAVDASDAALARLAGTPNVTTARADLSDAASVRQVIAAADLVVCAVPGFMGFATLKTIIEAGKNVVDISFFPEDPFELDAPAREKGVTAVVDCGVAPGLCNIIAGYVDARLDRTDEYICYVGGLPKVRNLPYQYKAVFSPIDVLEEYTRPARLVENGEIVVRPALSEVELLDFPGVGTLEAFNTDGLRSLMKTLDAPFMKEKTMRYPGHAELMRIFRESGFFSAEPLTVGGQSVRPLDVTAKLLFKEWKLQPGEEDFTLMRVILRGEKDGQSAAYRFDLFDTFDPETGVHSMARTTGYTATIVARQVLAGLFAETGICPPEYVGRTAGCFDNLLAEYAKRGISVTETVEAQK